MNNLHASPAVIGLFIIAIIVIAVSCFIGPAPLVVGAVLSGLFGSGDTASVLIIQEIRLPRALAAFVAGAALGAAGAGLQGLLRNPLADPGVLGVSSAAALGAVIVLYFGAGAVGFWAPAAGAIGFAFGATILLYVLGAERVSTARLILIGVGLSSFSGALISLAMNMAPNPFALADLMNWLFGSVANKSFRDLSLLAPVAGAGFLALIFARHGLRALTLGEEAAAGIGADLVLTRRLTIAGTAALVGASVAMAGAIGFVGIVAPHLARPLVQHDPARLILPSALLGGVMLGLADIAIRLAPFDQELRLGVAAALIGAPAFIWVAATTRRMTA